MPPMRAPHPGILGARPAGHQVLLAASQPGGYPTPPPNAWPPMPLQLGSATTPRHQPPRTLLFSRPCIKLPRRQTTPAMASGSWIQGPPPTWLATLICGPRWCCSNVIATEISIHYSRRSLAARPSLSLPVLISGMCA
ncbi:uncharacterized protein LOC119321839 [Triticum dicoccoides]|uniref:uncharacterized protein LOC119321839 n=1 Tax=Triticum dicoccoides TaxID=85692 RepID=UPI0018913C1A|nr:uncharacterized protein LOC119321839 [Triticum dicoccoides]